MKIDFMENKMGKYKKMNEFVFVEKGKLKLRNIKSPKII